MSSFNLLGDENTNNGIDVFKNPFDKNKCEEINITIRKHHFWTNNKVEYSARIKFSHGDTSGTQKIDADNFPELINKTQSFLNSL